MNTPMPDELEQMRRRLERLEHEVGEARRDLTALARRAVEPASPVVSTEVPTPEEKVEMPPPAAAMPPPLPPPPLPLRAAPSMAPLPLPTTYAGGARATIHEATERWPLRSWLERLQLWPPAAGEGSAEARLGAWWATRVGALLAVIGVVFFGIYVSLHTPPWVKFCELLAVSVGVSALGLWLERRLPAFGGVVFAGGLALLFFTAYAGHVVPGVRVFDTIWASVAWQGAAVALIVGVALWRRAPLIATLAIGLGHVTAIFSGRDGFDGFALGAAALLGVVAVALRRLRGWEGPSVVAMPAGYAVLFFGLLAAGRAGVATPPFAPWPFVAGLAALFFLRDWRREPAEAEDVTPGERWFQNTNASLAALAALVTALGWYREQLGVVYLVAATFFAAGAWARSRQVRGGDGVAAVLTAKAAAALTLGVIELAEARTVAIALLVQAWLLAWTARRLESRVLAVATGLTAAVATWFFFAHGLVRAPVFSMEAGRTVLFTVGLVALATEAGRWLVEKAETRTALELAAALVGAGGALLAIMNWRPSGWEAACAMGLALIFIGVARARRGRATAWASIVLAVMAQFWLWVSANEGGPSRTLALGWSALIVLAPTIWAGAVMGGRPGSGWHVGGTLAWALAVAGAVFVGFNQMPSQVALVATLGGALALAVSAPSLRGRHLPWLATQAAGLGWAMSMLRRPEPYTSAWLAAAALLAWALPVWLRAGRAADAERREEDLPETMERAQVLVATALGLRFLVDWLEPHRLVPGLAGMALAMVALALRPGVRPALAASLVVWLLTVPALLAARPGDGLAACAALLAWVPAWLLVRAPERWTAQFTGRRRHAPAVQCALATLIGVVCAPRVFDGAGEVFALVALLAAAACTVRPGGVSPARTAAVVAGFVLAWTTLALVVQGGAEGLGAGSAAVALAALALVALPMWVDPEKQRGWRLAGGGTGLALMFAACAAQDGTLAPYATVGWGLAAIALFMAGLFWRNAPYRVLGLVGLALCVPRIFVVDLQSMLHRIVAFIVIGVVMLWVGFSYHRFRHLVTDSTDTPDTPPPSS